jgi:Trm5-related predicted tRNA methylase
MFVVDALRANPNFEDISNDAKQQLADILDIASYKEAHKFKELQKVFNCLNQEWVTVPEPRWRCVVVDHKNVGKMGNESAKYYLDRQMVTNLALARAHGYPVEAVLVNVQSRRTYECRRFEVPINPIHYNRLFADTIYFLDQMKAVRQTHLDPSNRPRNTAACVGKFGQCDYYSLCWEGGSVGEFSTGK